MITPVVVVTLRVSANPVSGAGPSNSRDPVPEVDGWTSSVYPSTSPAACRFLRTLPVYPYNDVEITALVAHPAFPTSLRAAG